MGSHDNTLPAAQTSSHAIRKVMEVEVSAMGCCPGEQTIAMTQYLFGHDESATSPWVDGCTVTASRRECWNESIHPTPTPSPSSQFPFYFSMTPFPLIFSSLNSLSPIQFTVSFWSSPHWSRQLFCWQRQKRKTWLPDSSQDVSRRSTSALPYYSLFSFLLSSLFSPIPPYLCLL